MKESRICWKDFIIGFCMATWILLVVYLAFLKPGTTSTSDTDSAVAATEGSSEEVISYDTDIKNWELTTDSGETVKFTTPDGFYSLSDQYLDNLKTYSGVDTLESDDMIVVGDEDSVYSSNTVINVDTLSNVSNMLRQLYGDSYDAESMTLSEAYVYMTTGELPDDVPLNYEIEEIKTYEVNGITYKCYEVNYDTEYESESADEESTETGTEIVHTQQIACYSNTEDAIELICYQTTFNRDEALGYIEEFLGVK